MNLRRLFGRRPKSSSIARQRLKVVISQDRFDVDEESMRTLQLELMQVLSKHFDFQMDAVRMSLKHRGSSYVLTADFPHRHASQRDDV